MSVKGSFRRHGSQPGVSAHAYRRRKLSTFRERLHGRKAIYLDVNYWIDLQKADAGKPRREEFVELLRLLRGGVKSGQIMCPPSTTAALEFGKQSDVSTRRATGRLVDELCCGAGLLPDDELISMEVARLLIRSFHPNRLTPDRRWVWTPVGCMLAGQTPPDLPVRQTAQQRTRYEKTHFDMLYAATMEELVQFERPDMPSPWARLAETLNEGSEAHSHEITSFDSLLASEAQGAAEASAGMISTALAVIWRELDLPSDVDLDVQKWVRLVGAALAKSDKAKVGLPSLYIRSGLHALLRWNRRQRFKPNDVLDFAHAAGALGYCDLFLTEGPLKDMLGRGPLKLAHATACEVHTDPSEAIRAVATLLDDDRHQHR